LVGHDMGLMAQSVDRLGVMYAGTMAEVCEVGALFREPLHPYSQLLIASLPTLLLRRPPGCPFRPRCPYAIERCAVEDPPLREARPNHWVACHLYDRP